MKLKVGLFVVVLAVVGWIYFDAFQCWRSGGSPVSSIGHFVCVEGAR